MNKKIDLKYIIENEYFVICPFLTTDRFVSYCNDRDAQTSKEQLEQFEKLGIFYPLARVQYPKIKIKVEYSKDRRQYSELDILKDGEEWSGDIIEKYSAFSFEKEFAENWLEEGLLWEPFARPFQSWETFRDENGFTRIQSFYSIFQCYTLYNLIRSIQTKIGAEWWISYSKDEIIKVTSTLSDWAEKVIQAHQKNGIRGELAAGICQIISDRYFPKTQSDRRSIRISISSEYHGWNWYEYCRAWDAKSVLDNLGMTADYLKDLQELVALDATVVDPLEHWYGLISFVSLDKKNRLKGKALLAQALYSMEEMLRLFYEEITGKSLPPPDESPTWKKDNFYGKGVTQNELQYLEFLANQYHLNPRPKLILVVEGDGEEEQFPRLAEELFKYSLAKLGVEVVNLEGVGNFTGRKKIDRCGALEKFIDDYHSRQTIVFAVLDKEGRVPAIKERLIKTPSKYYPKRTVTKAEYIHVWNKTIEFDNFSQDEIALAMTEMCQDSYVFSVDEITNCETRFVAKQGDPLSKLFKEKTGLDLSKRKLLETLCGFVISHPENEFDANKKAKRPIVAVLKKVIDLAARNYQPVTLDIWERNQESGYFGGPIT